MLRALAENLWAAEQPLRFLGLEVGCRMTVVRLADGRLVLHSPVRDEEALALEVAALGSPGWIVAPNRFHHLFVGAWHVRHPGAALLVAPGLREKRRDLAAAAVLSSAPPGWGDELAVEPIAGFPFANEVVLFHRPTATLIAADLAINVGAESPALTRLVMRLGGRVGELAPTVLEKLLIRDRPAYRASLERVLQWPFERVIVSHGAVVERGGREALARGYDWLLAAG